MQFKISVFFVCHLCSSRQFGFPFVHLHNFCSLLRIREIGSMFYLLVTFLQPKRTTYLHTYGRKSVYVSTPSLRSLDVCWYLWPCLTTPFHYTCTPTVLAKYISVGQSGVCKKIPSKLPRSVCIRLKPVSPLTNLGQYHVRIGV